MFIVTGATGQLGRAIVQALARRISPDWIVATCRDPGKATDLAALGVHVRHGDFSDPGSLREAFAGARQILLVSSNARAYSADPVAQHRNAVDAARQAGAQRVVYTSHIAASADSAFPPMHDHAATEALLRDCGMAWTALRHGFYAQSAIAMLNDALASGLLETAADGPVAWTAHADLAEAAAIILTQTSQDSGPTPPLTGAEALDLAALVQIASELRGRSISRRVLSDEEMQAALKARGTPAPVIKIALGFYIASRNGEFSAVDPTLGKLLRRAPMRIRELIAAKISAMAA